ncbi:hypothetical protein [Candidatus Reidiella endopervernicosa]|uniref:hypothetical protein n=1 Tax=Candidatus Reidiella endopervernicosa TaxID=2738883 RepID=UPI001F1CC966|nr:hypothetical protein [Candidatus Reidiella endopervernicosa]
MIRLLVAQAAVAIENARLYEQVQEYTHTLEERVAERTAQLSSSTRSYRTLQTVTVSPVLLIGDAAMPIWRRAGCVHGASASCSR